MKDHYSSDTDGETQDNLPTGSHPSPPNVKTRPKTDKPNKGTNKPKYTQKWTLRQHWRRANSAKKLRWYAEAIGLIIGASVLGTYIWSNLQSKWHFEAEHRPLVIFTGLALLGPISCDSKAGQYNIGPMQISVKNVGSARAVTAFAMLPETKLVPNNKTGDQRIDSLPAVTDDLCTARFVDHTIGHPLAPGEAVTWNIAQAAGAFRNPIMLDNTAPIQFYTTACVSYEAEGGTLHTACNLLRFARREMGTAPPRQ